MDTHKRSAVFLDKDGTLVKNIPYNVDPRQIKLETGVLEGLRRLKAAGYLLVVVSNQSGIARGHFTEEALGPVWERMQEIVGAQAGLAFDRFYYCPHHPDGFVPSYAVECTCRKPQPGMLLAAANDLNLDLASCWIVGDILDDIEAGHQAGCRAVLINNGNETEWKNGPYRKPDYIATDLADAAEHIIREQASRPEPRESRPRSLAP